MRLYRAEHHVEKPPRVKQERVTRVRKTVEDRFWAKVDKDGPLPRVGTRAEGLERCWLWTGASHDGKYGQFRISTERRVPAHVFSFELAKHRLYPCMEPDHLCEVHRCVNPEHLEAVTHGENVRRYYRKA